MNKSSKNMWSWLGLGLVAILVMFGIAAIDGYMSNPQGYLSHKQDDATMNNKVVIHIEIKDITRIDIDTLYELCSSSNVSCIINSRNKD